MIINPKTSSTIKIIVSTLLLLIFGILIVRKKQSSIS